MKRVLEYQATRELLQQMAPQYQQASAPQKKKLLETFVMATGYVRKYATWLLNHPEEVSQTLKRPRLPQYGPEVQQALVQIWNAANRICARRLIPFLPAFMEALERHGHLQITEECRRQLLTMSVATADRLLSSQRKGAPGGLSTTRAGTLLKQQIPIRTFQDWNEMQPGFLEADLVAHCGVREGGNYLYTLTLTDIATGWTECLPLLYRSRENVVAAFQTARALFPFPILGIDTDNGGEFINEVVVAYCEAEQITFTRGRPYQKRDQCFVEQKNGGVVRQVVGYDRLVGEHAYRQLTELYRALRLYVNCFQPSMKLVSKQREGKKVRYVYDPAKTPLQRLLLSGVLPALKQQELSEVAQALDPVRLLQQVEHLQQAIFRCAVGGLPVEQTSASASVQVFSVEGCAEGTHLVEESVADPGTSNKVPLEQEWRNQVLNWPRTQKDPFAGEWEYILSCLMSHPERSSGDLFRELERRSPGRYQPLHIRTLQRGMRKIRDQLRETFQEQWQQEVIHGRMPEPMGLEKPEQEADKPAAFVRSTTLPPTSGSCQQQAQEPSLQSHLSTEEESLSPSGKMVDPVCPTALTSWVDAGREQAEARVLQTQPTGEEEAMRTPETATGAGVRTVNVPSQERSQANPTSRTSIGRISSGQRCSEMTIERAIQEYLEEQKRRKRRPKTLEWHQTALALFQQYLQKECHCVFIDQITQTQVQSWLTFLREMPTARGTRRSADTMNSYARSARAFCQWLVRRRYLKRTPFAHLVLPKVGPPPLHLLEPQEWERLLQVCWPLGEKTVAAERAATRNQAILWVLAQTGISPSELCKLCLGDVDREQGVLRVRGKGSRQRWVPLGQEGLRHLLVYLDQYRLETATGVKRRRLGEEPLFVSETGRPLTENGIALLFGRLRKRAGITRKEVGPALLRDSFAVRYLQTGGDVFTLRELLGQEESVRVKRALQMNER